MLLEHKALLSDLLFRLGPDDGILGFVRNAGGLEIAEIWDQVGGVLGLLVLVLLVWGDVRAAFLLGF